MKAISKIVAVAMVFTAGSAFAEVGGFHQTPTEYPAMPSGGKQVKPRTPEPTEYPAMPTSAKKQISTPAPAKSVEMPKTVATDASSYEMLRKIESSKKAVLPDPWDLVPKSAGVSITRTAKMFSPNDPNKAIEVKITIIREPSSGNMYAVNNLRSMLSDEELSKQIAKAEALAGKSRTKALGHLMDKIAGISINPYSGLFYHGQHHTGTSYKDHTDIFIRKEVGTSNLIVALSSDGHESYELLGMMQ